MDKEGALIKNKAEYFMRCLRSLQNSIREKHISYSEKEGYHLSDEDAWYLQGFISHAADIHALFAEYMNNKRYRFVRCILRNKRCYNYRWVWMEYNDRFDVDLLWGDFNSCLLNREIGPEIMVTRGRINSHQKKWEKIKILSSKQGLDCGQLETLLLGPKMIHQCLSANGELLNRVYQRISEYMQETR